MRELLVFTTTVDGLSSTHDFGFSSPNLCELLQGENIWYTNATARHLIYLRSIVYDVMLVAKDLFTRSVAQFFCDNRSTFLMPKGGKDKYRLNQKDGKRFYASIYMNMPRKR